MDELVSVNAKIEEAASREASLAEEDASREATPTLQASEDAGREALRKDKFKVKPNAEVLLGQP